MNYFFKTTKNILILFILVTFFYFTPVPRAQAAFNMSNCIDDMTKDVAETGIVTWGVEIGLQWAWEAFGFGAATSAAILAVPTSDIPGTSELGGIKGINNAHTQFQDVIMQNLDAWAYGVGQCALQLMTNQTIEWIKGGFAGSPNYSINVDKLFQDLSDSVAKDLAFQIDGLNACDFTPQFKTDLINSVKLSAQSRSISRNRYSQRVKCPFPSTIDPAVFLQDFKQGGWAGFEASLSDSGNPFGVGLATRKEQKARDSQAKEVQQGKLTQSSGFLDILDWDGSTLSADPGCAFPWTVVDNWAGMGADNQHYYAKQYCNTKTPGKTVEDQLSKSLGTEFDRLGFADSLNKIISALIGQVNLEVRQGLF